MADRRGMTAHPLNELGLAEAARKIAAREITSEALARACLDRVFSREKEVRAFAALNAEHVIAQARRCDAGEPGGPLHGVPVAIKDVLNTADLPTQMGSPIYAGYQTINDSSCVALLRAAGAVILGKTATCEFAGSFPGPTRNPLDLARTPGGSSSGSGAAVADFMAPLALGTQTGGSVLRPASFCGVIGFKPTYNIVNREGLKFAAENLDTIGWMAREIDDIALCLDVLTQCAPAILTRPAKAPRIGVCQTPEWSKSAPETRAALDHASRMAAKAGAIVNDAASPDSFQSLARCRDIINDVERSRALAWEWAAHRGKLSANIARNIGSGLAVSNEVYGRALQFAEQSRRDASALLEPYDFLIAPCVNGEAPPGLDYAGDPSFQGIWTILHVPAVSIPCVRGPNGMPVGIQLIAPRYTDRRLLEWVKWMIETAGLDGAHRVNGEGV